MNYRRKASTVVLTLTALVPLDRRHRFADGFRLSLTPFERAPRLTSSATMTARESSIHNPMRRKKTPGIGRKTRTISFSSPLIVSATNNAYGRGADIWPEANNDAIKLTDSFPNGIVPYNAALAVEQNDIKSIREQVQSSTGAESNTYGTRRPRNYIKRILRRAVSKQELDNEQESGFIDKVPIVIALLLLVKGMATPMDVALVASWTTYFTILNMTAQSARDVGTPMLPAVPPQGHVPWLLSNPLGMGFKRSSTYRRWLKLGALLGLIGPIAWLFVKTVVIPLQGGDCIKSEAARAVGRPLFLICAQMSTETISKRNLVPLPLRVLVPIIYNASRSVYLWHWAFAATNLSLGRIGRALGIMNIVYCIVNLFAFLIPIASIRYMRAHFFGVEAECVTTRIGLEETLGLVPNNISL